MNHDDHTFDDAGSPETAGDPLAPDRVEATIAQFLAGSEAATSEGRLVRSLAAEHAPPPDANAALARVADRLAREPLAVKGRPTRPGSPAVDGSRSSAPGRRHVRTGRRANTKSLSEQPLVRTIAAVFMVGLLVGGFLAVLRLRSVPAKPMPAWQDVSLSAARTGSLPKGTKLAGATTYAIADDGTIYACNANHLWYSRDAGATYQAFTPELAALFADSSSLPPDCAIATIPGASGLFAAIPDPSATPSLQATSAVGYAAPGAAGWQVLRLPDTHPTIGQPGYGIDLARDQFWTRIVANLDGAHGDGTQVRVDGYAFYLLLPYATQPFGNLPLIGTPDFGQNWEWFDEQIEGQGSSCLGIAADPDDPTHLFCATGLPGAASTGVSETRDGGKTWQPAGLSANASAERFELLGTSAQAVYAQQGCLSCQNGTAQVLRRAISGGTWQFVASLGTDSQGVHVIGLLPDGTLYAQTNTRANFQHYQVQALRLAPGATQFSPIGPTSTLPFTGRIAFALGGGSSGVPAAVYAHAQVQPSTQPLYRLLVASVAAVPTPVGTLPAATLPPFAPTPVPTPYSCPGAPGDVGTVQPGGLGANIDTFAPRWGDFQGYAGDIWEYGRYTDTNQIVVRFPDPSPPPGQRVPAMSYSVDSTAHLSLTDAETLARTILPADAVAVGGALQFIAVPNSAPQVALFCSPAYGALFPVGTRTVGVDGTPVTLTGSGLVAVSYALRPDGSVATITLGPAGSTS